MLEPLKCWDIMVRQQITHADMRNRFFFNKIFSYTKPVWPGFDSRTCVICGLSLLLVPILAPRVFLRVLRFSSLLKNQHSKFQFDLMHVHFITRSQLFRVTRVNKLHLHIYICIFNILGQSRFLYKRRINESISLTGS